ncbi:hypothetical protein [Streptomyces tubercidicus]|uniref:hypothetical protein n=1 Tax=Streptomyces tubercidicus TaxID=47759 RepID=UPI0034669458
MSDIYDDGAPYGPDPDATTTDTPTDPVYDDGDVYGQAAAAVNDGLAQLFVKLGPPTTSATEQ